MNVKLNVKRKFKVNGKEYNSIEEMPPDIRKAFEKVIASEEGNVKPSVMQTKIIFNDTEYTSIEEMPQDVRQLYEKVLKAAETGKMPPGLVTTDDLSGPRAVSKTSLNINTGDMGTPIKTEPAFSQRTLIIGIALITLMILLYFVFQSK